MPKMKTKSSAKKRFKVTGTKLALTHSGLVHDNDMNSVKEQLRLK